MYMFIIPSKTYNIILYPTAWDVKEIVMVWVKSITNFLYFSILNALSDANGTKCKSSIYFGEIYIFLGGNAGTGRPAAGRKAFSAAWKNLPCRCSFTAILAPDSAKNGKYCTESLRDLQACCKINPFAARPEFWKIGVDFYRWNLYADSKTHLFQRPARGDVF